MATREANGKKNAILRQKNNGRHLKIRNWADLQKSFVV